MRFNEPPSHSRCSIIRFIRKDPKDQETSVLVLVMEVTILDKSFSFYSLVFIFIKWIGVMTNLLST